MEILTKLNEGVPAKEADKAQLLKVFEESFDTKSIDSQKFLLQKLNYIHLNPVNGIYNLVEDWKTHEHGSAGFYNYKPSHIPRLTVPTNARMLL